jgi:hypothetical protein
MPLSQEAFQANRNSPQKDFIRNGHISWAKYKSEIIEPLDKILPDVNSIGVKIFSDTTLQQFKELFTAKNRVIILVAHSPDGSFIEFYDKLYSINDVSRCIPSDYTGFLNLCVCNQVRLAESIAAGNDNCRVLAVNDEVSISLWLYYYWIFLRYIHENVSDYFSAVKLSSKIFYNTFPQ